MKRRMSIILTLAMALTLLSGIPLTAGAATTNVTNAASLNSAIISAASGDTLVLTQNITDYNEPIVLDGISITINIGSYNLDIAVASIDFAAIEVFNGGRLTVNGAGRLTVRNDAGIGISVYDLVEGTYAHTESGIVELNCPTTVTANSTGISASASSGYMSYRPKSIAKVHVNGNVTGRTYGIIAYRGAWSDEFNANEITRDFIPTKVTVTGNVTASAQRCFGIVAQDGADVRVGGDVTISGDGMGVQAYRGNWQGQGLNGLQFSDKFTPSVVHVGRNIKVNHTNTTPAISRDGAHIVVEGMIETPNKYILSNFNVYTDYTDYTRLSVAADYPGAGYRLFYGEQAEDVDPAFVWLRDRHPSVTYNANGGNGSDYVVPNVSYGSIHTVVDLPTAGFSRTGFTFTGWNTAANGGGITCYPDDILTVTDNHTLYAQWAPALERDKHIRYIQGYPNGSVRPEGSITRAEAAAIFYRLIIADDKDDPLTVGFSDVIASNWFYKEVAYLAKYNIIVGYANGTFRPQNRITRAEFATIASRFDKLETNVPNVFIDVPNTHWAVGYINSAAAKNARCLMFFVFMYSKRNIPAGKRNIIPNSCGNVSACLHHTF